MQGVLNLYKQMGETPLARLERLRQEKPLYAQEVLSYAGRLDPMAEGVLLALVGRENTRRESYLHLDKEYVLDVLFGFSTDTYDILGRVMESGEASGITKKKIKEALSEFRGSLSQEYPPFSSKTVGGRALFEWARADALDTIVVPEKTIVTHDLTIIGMYKILESTLYGYIERNVEKMQGDFRQDEILRLWSRELERGGKREFTCVTIRIACSSGTYARSIASNVGKSLGVPALALHILRTKVGDYSIEKSMK